jgi:hypothetical protein
MLVVDPAWRGSVMVFRNYHIGIGNRHVCDVTYNTYMGL